MERKAAVFGSTGLVGYILLKFLDENRSYHEIVAYRRNLVGSNPFQKVRFVELGATVLIEPDTEDVFICLGTTMKKAGSKAAFKAVDLDLVIEIARKAYHAGVKRIIVVSSIGASPISSNFYLRTKGQMEEELKKIDFELVALVRPSILLGKRNEFRFGERVGICLFRAFKFIFVGPLRRYRGIDASDVAKAMVQLALTARGKIVVETEVLKQIADVYKP
jgi:uncharacterized protein YbjT (DUF2867 family)